MGDFDKDGLAADGIEMLTQKKYDKDKNSKTKINWVPILLFCIVIEMGLIIKYMHDMKVAMGSIKSDVWSLKYDVGEIQSDVSTIEIYVKQ